MLRKILVPVRGDGKGANVLTHAVLLARRFAAHLDVIHCRPRAEDLMPFGVPVPAFLREQFVDQAASVADTVEQELRGLFDRFAAEQDLEVVDRLNGEGPSASWLEEQGKQVDVIKRHGRLSDLIVVAKPDRDQNLGTNTLKASLFNTGRPVLMCPPSETGPESLGERVTIAWNGSVESVRAVAMAFDLLASASAVTILTVDRTEIHSASAQDLADYLAARGVTAEIEQFKSKDKIGLELLQRTAAVGADMMIMGAYGDSHERETIFGGNTQVVVDNATIPVVLVH